MRIVRWLVCVSALCALPLPGLGQPADGALLAQAPGCGQTSTRPYGGYILPGWDAAAPKAMVIASDSQYPRTLNSGDDPAGSSAALRRVFTDIAAYRQSVGGAVPTSLNGDLTEFAHGDERGAVQALFPLLQTGAGAPLFLPGLGNHDYGNNVGDCANNGCARDAVCDHLYWVGEIGPRTQDYYYAEPLHEGSFSYMVYSGGIALIQLNDSPLYIRSFETGGYPTDPKREFRVNRSLQWLEGALRMARQDNKRIFINLHKRNGWPSGDAARFRQLIESYGVQAAFAGHLHEELGLAEGTSGNFGSVPVFQSGALLKESYLIVEFADAPSRFVVFRVNPGEGHARKEKIGEYPFVAPPELPAIDFSDAEIVLYKGNGASQAVICRRSLPLGAFNMGGSSGCANDDTRSLRILKAKKGTMIRLFGAYNHTKSEGYAFIYVKRDILLPQTVSTFDTSRDTESWRLVRFGGGQLDGKVSSMSMFKDHNAGNSEMTLFEDNNLGGDVLCTKPIAHDVRFNMGSGGGEGCDDDEARSGAWFKVKAGMEVCYYAAPDQSHRQGHTCINAHRDMPLMVINSFNSDYTAPDGSYTIRSHGDIDGDISSMWAENLFPYPPRNTTRGCSRTLTRSYKSFIGSGWNANAPTWLVVGSDTEYAGTRRGLPRAKFDDPAYDALKAVFADIGSFRKARGVDGPVPLMINGDNTDAGLDYERYSMQALYPLLAGSRGEPLFLPGLGERDYDDNVDTCFADGDHDCVRDSICDVLQWTNEVSPVTRDYHHGVQEKEEGMYSGTQLHEGSYSYMVNVGDIALIQLNLSPLYERHVYIPGEYMESTQFQVRSSLRWLEGALRLARSGNKSIFINMHRREGWPPGDTERFKRLLQDYGVQAVFAGHRHGELGLAGGSAPSFGNIPVFQSGALANQSYLIVEMLRNAGQFAVYKVMPGAGHANRQLVGKYTLRSAPPMPEVDFSDALIALDEGNDGTQDVVCRIPVPFTQFNLPGAHGCSNDEARSMRILKAPEGTVIRLYGNWDHKPDQGYAAVTVTRDITLPVTVGSFDRTATHSAFTVEKHGSSILDGKVSSITMGDVDGTPSEPWVVFYKGNDAGGDIVCESPLPFAAFNLPGTIGCENDDIRSMRILKAKKGTMIRVFGNWDHMKDQGYAFVTAIRDILAPVLIGSFERSYTDSDVKVESFGSQQLDGKISSMATMMDMPVEAAPAMAPPREQP